MLKKLSAFDVRCERGPVPHAHPPAEHAARVQAYFDGLRELSELRARISAPGGVA